MPLGSLLSASVSRLSGESTLPLPAGDGQGAGRGGQRPPGRARTCEMLELGSVGPANTPVHPRAWHW